ncbi:PREDICTED: chymotrypsin-1-like [Nicrophorus vespilloides]|uniref:Chymotrypsin-1-like n=1 Tax=Nicrophorus vespilloides TaxID=110193 RepID=A0ABM1MMN7_NICVS|nr:PREDICTED: chymotrypsin-1-like [Nicrophorus vespilloides]
MKESTPDSMLVAGGDGSGKMMLRFLVVSVLSFMLVESKFSWKIIGGENAYEGFFPYHVSVKLKGSHLCGGSIVTTKWIITSASCVQDVDISSLSVVVGSIKVNSGGFTYKAEKAIYHEYYDPYLNDFDIAVIKLKESIEYGDFVQPIGLTDRPVSGEEDSILVGWGSKSEYFSEDLQYIIAKTISREKCENMHSSSLISDSHICTYTPSGGTCLGDTGGPLVDISEGKLIGIISWMRPCVIGTPDVYTSIYHFRSWILQQITK